MSDKMAGKVALITGASSGIGEALALELARRGARPVLTARRADRIEAIAQGIRESGGQALAVGCDVTRDGDLEAAAAAAREALGRIDVVIANAGFGVMGRMDALSLDDVRRQFETNVFGVVRTVSATVEDLKRSRGSLALIGSVNGYVSLPGSGPYAMSKAAVRALADTLRAELSASGVSVTHVGPGFVESEIRRVDNQGGYRAERADPVPGWLQMATPKAAREIVDAVAAREAEVIVTRHAKVAVALARHAPGLTAAVLGVAGRWVQPRGRGRS